MIEPTYPEHMKQAAVLDEARTIGEFLEWLTGLSEEGGRGIELAEWVEDHNELQRANIGGFNKLLAEYFKIDLVKIEQEKEQMYRGLKHG